VVSDHSPCDPKLKQLDQGDFVTAWGGISSLEVTLPATWTGAMNRGHSLHRLANWMSEAPARLCGLAHRKGALSVGKDADFVVFHPERMFDVDGAKLHHRHSVTPYAGRSLHGVVEQTYVQGVRVYHAGSYSARPVGSLLARER
jgi:allantoinase